MLTVRQALVKAIPRGTPAPDKTGRTLGAAPLDYQKYFLLIHVHAVIDDPQKSSFSRQAVAGPFGRRRLDLKF
jgi:hypothetical protein